MSETNQDNPYATPSTDVDTGLKSRSSLPKVIGIISIVLAVLGLLTAIGSIAAMFFMPSMLEAQLKMGFDKNYLIVMNAVAIITSFWALYIGLKLVKYKDVGRRHFNYYTVVNALISVVNYFMTKNMMGKMYADMEPEIASAAMDASSITSLSVFLGPVILIIVAILLNQQKVKDSLLS